ncbi:MAG: Bifunctional phosphoglucose/phosphomannose isomerase [Parcubacteria group bacterium GW2011_GWC2_45_7]|nr:MAG: Bifunctional phosphoglucose/phosphomannose isomerase [Parcubacteria group bacterium GW2011_GWC2_45_7]KKU73660.1 MAG: Bifunctional phosphoglucose/phosphomannose isomerase [Parcubacteria group bacterium GW2011_GWA2_47_26]
MPKSKTASLDNSANFKKYDPHHVLESVLALPKQCTQAWSEASRIKLPPEYSNPTNIVVAAMGGSGLGAHLIKSVFSAKGGSAAGGEPSLRIPLEIINHYQLPAYVGKNTLVIIISYSGSTEEPLAAAKEAKKRQAKIAGVTAGGELKTWLKQNNLPAYIFNPLHNPSGQPRLGTSYLLMGTLGLLINLPGIFTTPSKKLATLIQDAIRATEEAVKKYGPAIPASKNPAKQLATKLHERGALIFASEHLLGNAHILANQIHESAKQFAAWFAIPEMNHHLMEGLTFPKLNHRYLTAIFLESSLYHPRVATRYPITKDVLQKQKVPAFSFALQSQEHFNQAIETLTFGGFLSFYLTMLNHIDPSKIPWVDYFKKRLANGSVAECAFMTKSLGSERG